MKKIISETPTATFFYPKQTQDKISSSSARESCRFNVLMSFDVFSVRSNQPSCERSNVRKGKCTRSAIQTLRVPYNGDINFFIPIMEISICSQISRITSSQLSMTNNQHKISFCIESILNNSLKFSAIFKLASWRKAGIKHSFFVIFQPN